MYEEEGSGGVKKRLLPVKSEGGSCECGRSEELESLDWIQCTTFEQTEMCAAPISVLKQQLSSASIIIWFA